MKKLNYPHSAYGDDFCLKMNFALWAIIVFLMRPYIVLIVSITNGRDRMAFVNMIYGDRFMLVLGALASVFVIPVLVAQKKRRADAPAGIRWISRHGRIFLMIATCTNALFVFVPVALRDANRINMAGLAQLAICVWIIYHLFTSRRIKDTFADFPAHN